MKESSKVRVDYKAPPTLWRFLSSDKRVRCVVGPFGSGKSSACCLETVRRAKAVEPGKDGIRRSRWAVIRNTYPELRDTTAKTFRAWVPEALGNWKVQEFTFAMRFEDVESEVMFRALDRPDHVKKLLSLELTGAYINEAKEIPKAIFDALDGRIGRYPAINTMPEGVEPWCGIWMDTNPPDTDHWLYKLFEVEKPDGYELFRQPGGRAPGAENIAHLRAGYYERLAIGKDPDWVKVFVDGEYGFVVDGKPCFPEYQDSLHCKEFPHLPKQPVLLGQDFGLTPAAVLVQRDPADGQLQVVDELVATDMGAVSFARALKELLSGDDYVKRKAAGWGDPAGEQRSQVDETTPFQVVRAAGLNIVAAPTNDVTLRREAVALNLRRLTTKGRPALVIHPRCRTLRKAMQGAYCYRRKQITGREIFADVPDKNEWSHVADALQYVCVGEGEYRGAIDPDAERYAGFEVNVHSRPTKAHTEDDEGPARAHGPVRKLRRAHTEDEVRDG